MFPVNAIAFNTRFGTFATGGARACLDNGAQNTCWAQGRCGWLAASSLHTLRLCRKLCVLSLFPCCAGGDGVVNFWDGENKKRLAQVSHGGVPWEGGRAHRLTIGRTCPATLLCWAVLPCRWLMKSTSQEVC